MGGRPLHGAWRYVLRDALRMLSCFDRTFRRPMTTDQFARFITLRLMEDLSSSLQYSFVCVPALGEREFINFPGTRSPRPTLVQPFLGYYARAGVVGQHSSRRGQPMTLYPRSPPQDPPHHWVGEVGLPLWWVDLSSVEVAHVGLQKRETYIGLRFQPGGGEGRGHLSAGHNPQGVLPFNTGFGGLP